MLACRKDEMYAAQTGFRLHIETKINKFRQITMRVLCWKLEQLAFMDKYQN